MDTLFGLLVYGPIFLVGLVLIVKFFTEIVRSPEDSKEMAQTFRVTVSEIHEDGNILVSDDRMFSDGIMISYPDWRNIRLGQDILIRKEGLEWIVA